MVTNKLNIFLKIAEQQWSRFNFKINHLMSFYFDKILDSKTAHIELFEESALPLIDIISEGHNATCST